MGNSRWVVAEGAGCGGRTTGVDRLWGWRTMCLRVLAGYRMWTGAGGSGEDRRLEGPGCLRGCDFADQRLGMVAAADEMAVLDRRIRKVGAHFGEDLKVAGAESL